MAQRASENAYRPFEAIQQLSEATDFRAGLCAALHCVSDFFSARQAFLYELDEHTHGLLSRYEAYETNLPDGWTAALFPELTDAGCLTFTKEAGPDAAQHLLSARRMDVLLAVPLRVSGRIRWMLGLGDPQENAEETRLLTSLGFMLSSELSRRAAVAEQQRLEAVCRTNDERYRIARASTGIAVWDYDFKTKRILPSPADSGPVIENVPESLVKNGHILPDSVPAYLAMYERLQQGEKSVEGVFHVHVPEDPNYTYKHIRYSTVFDENGTPSIAIGLSENVTEKYATQQNYIRELQLQNMLAADMYATMLLDVNVWRILRFQCRDAQVQSALEKYAADGVIHALARNVISESTSSSLFQDMSPAALVKLHAEKTDLLTSEYRYLLADGKTRWMREIARLLTEPSNGHLILHIQLQDIDEDRRRLDELSRAAETDSMTGLLNHDATIAHMRCFLGGEGRHGFHALFMIDIDNFKSVNDRLGHLKGDEAIMQIARGIIGLFRGTDILGRIGGDEFLILMKNVGSRALVKKKAAELVDTLQFVCSAEALSVDLSVSVGVCLYTEDEESLETLQACADAALYRAKNAGKNRYSISAGGGKRKSHAPNEAESSDIIQLRTLFEHMDGGIMLTDVGDSITTSYVSPSFFKSLGRSRAEVGEHGEKALDLVLDEDLPALLDALRATSKSDAVLDTTFRVHLAGSGTGWRHLRAARLPVDTGGVPKLISVVSDITELKRASAQLEAIVENAPCGIGMLEYDGEHLKSLFINRTMLNIANMASKEAFIEALGGDAFSTIQDDERPGILEELQRGIDEDRPFEVVYRSADKRDGVKRIIKVRGVRLHGYEQNGHPVLLLMYTDVTRETEMENALRLAEERYRIAITCAGIMLWEVDIPARTMRQTPEVAQRFGGSSREITGLPEGLLAQGNVAPDSVAETRRMFTDMFAGRDGETYYLRSRFDGKYMWLKARFKVLLDEQGDPYYAVGISEHVPNVDADMRRFEQECQIASQLEDNLFAAACVNLSRWRVDNLYTSSGQYAAADIQSADELHALAMLLVADQSSADDYLAMLSRPFLSTMFRNNRRFLFSGFLRSCPDGFPRWTDCSVHLLRHPVSGELYGFFYLRDADIRRRRELTLPQSVGFDPATKLYSNASFEALARSMLTEMHTSSELCTMTVLELVGLDQLRALRSAGVVHELLFTIGRFCRVMLSGNVIAGALDESHIIVFRADAGSVNAQQSRIRRMRERIDSTLRRSYPDDPIELVFGYAAEPFTSANYDTLVQSALLACRSALSRADSSIVLSSESAAQDSQYK